MPTKQAILDELQRRNIDINTVIDTASEMHGLEPSLVHSMVKQESNYNSRAISPKGAMGVMQLMPDTAKELGVTNPLNPIENVMAGTKYLSSLKDKYGGDMKLALSAYNAGEGNVDKYGGVPPFKETQDYVNKILPSAKPKKEFTKPIFSKRDIYNELKNRGMVDEEIFDTMLKANPVKEKPSFWKGLIEEVPEFGGAIVGSLAGTPGGIPGMIAGAFIGGAAGKAYQQIGQQVLEPEKAPKTPIEAAQQIGWAGTRQAGYEAGGQLVTRVAGKILAPFVKSILPETQIARQTLDAYMPVEKRWFGLSKRKVPSLLPHEATENRTLDVLFNISEGSLIGGRKISRFKVNREKAIGDLLDDVIDQFGARAEPDMVGEAFQMAVEKKIDARDLITNPIYNTIEDMTNNLFISKPVTKQVVSNILDRAGNPIIQNVTTIEKVGIISTKRLKEFAKPLAKIAKETKGIEAKNAGDDLIQGVMALDDNISFAAAKELRTRLISRVDEFNVINKKAPAIGRAKRLKGLLTQSINEGLQKHSPEALDLWNQVRRIYKVTEEKYNNQFIRRLIKKADPDFGGNPEDIVKAVFKPGAISNIRRVKTAVDTSTFEQMKSWYIQKVFMDSHVEEKLIGSKLHNNLFGRTGMGEKTLREIFTPQEYQRIKNVSDTLKMVTKKQEEATGRMWIQLTQASAVIGLITGAFKKASTLVLGAPEVFTRIVLSPTGNKWLTDGFKMPVGSPQFMANMGRLIGLSKNIQDNLDRELKIKEREKIKEYQDLVGISTLK